ncbi:putative bifunctional diguanylate cyclase/phosphodiesterase [Sulfurimonas hydrogeniphila]|uniref:putative bifunctional diguanylate cyclase/phosphodiesterase n=1 Tax=Sulfurimonas TaxID=202746 RepID=UPI00125EB2E6|nr:bifunctional diguanylate cyclase/phosphodiesterase [Sulfurimonas hydrogeniphila]
MKNLAKIYFFIFILIAVGIGYLYFSLQHTTQKLSANVNRLFIQQANEFAKNISREITQQLPQDENFFDALFEGEYLREELEREISLIATDTYKYVFVLYRDESGTYRYLLDGSKKDKGEFGEKLHVNKEIWDQVWKNARSHVFYHKQVETLWVTYLYPVVIDGKTQAIIAIDFSNNIEKQIHEALLPLKTILFSIFAAIFLMFIVILLQLYFTYKTKKENLTDPLTGAYNRNYLREFLNNVQIENYKILMVDIDHFKQVNDTYGHQTGDKILQEVSKIIKNTIRDEDRLIRFGGEEFIIFIKKSRGLASECKVAKRIRENIAATNFHYNNQDLRITVSIGVTCRPQTFKTVSDAIKHADEMLYVAKRDGRNQVVLDAVNRQKEAGKQKLLPVYEVQEAIEEGRVVCYYQPIFHIKSRKIHKYEALVRIQNRDGSITPPMEFLPVVMHTNIYNLLTKTILGIVFEKIKENRVSISINLNFSDIIDKNIFSLILNELEQNKEYAHWLIIELLEYEPLDNSSEIFIKNLQSIKACGVKIAIDDFGSGFANYTLFQSLPIDIVKIDASIIKNIDTPNISKSITESILTLTNALNIETVAEFVHSLSVLKTLEDMNIDYAQGYYLGKPEATISIL